MSFCDVFISQAKIMKPKIMYVRRWQWDRPMGKSL